MFAILSAIEDGHSITLCFASKKDAEQFKQFANTYMDESGAGNGYGAYWVYRSSEVIRCDKVPPGSTTRLEQKFINSMTNDILVARTANRNHSAMADISIGIKNKAISFSFGNLPERQRPAVGDMFRTMKSQANEEEKAVGEGRVIEDLGETLKVISCWDEGDDGRPKSNAKLITVRDVAVMKINDWKSEHRSNRAKV